MNGNLSGTMSTVHRLVAILWVVALVPLWPAPAQQQMPHVATVASSHCDAAQGMSSCECPDGPMLCAAASCCTTTFVPPAGPDAAVRSRPARVALLEPATMCVSVVLAPELPPPRC